MGLAANKGKATTSSTKRQKSFFIGNPGEGKQHAGVGDADPEQHFLYVIKGQCVGQGHFPSRAAGVTAAERLPRGATFIRSRTIASLAFAVVSEASSCKALS